MASLPSRFAKVERKLTTVVRTQRAQGEKVAKLSTRVSRLDSARKALGLPARRSNPLGNGPRKQYALKLKRGGYFGGNSLPVRDLKNAMLFDGEKQAKEMIRDLGGSGIAGGLEVVEVERFPRSNPTVMRTSSGKPIQELSAFVYTTRHRWPKWNRTITVTDERRLMRREFPGFTAADHRDAARVFAARSDEMAGLHGLAIRAAYKKYGENGPLISGIGHAGKFPEGVKNKLRVLAHRASAYRTAAHAHWAASGSRSAMPYGTKDWTYSQAR